MTEKLNAMTCNAPAAMQRLAAAGRGSTGDATAITPDAPTSMCTPATAEDVQKLLDAMQGMAVLLRTMNSRVQDLEAQVRRLEKVTPAQASELNADIRKRAQEVCRVHKAEGCEKAVAAAIRKAIKGTCGISSMRDLPRCVFKVAQRQIEMWDDYALMKAMRRKGGRIL